MVTFKDFMLEYADPENAFFFGVSKIKHKLNGKALDRSHLRKHKNIKPKEYDHKHPLINGIIQGSLNNVPLNNIQLNQILKDYNTTFDGKPKTLGNSGAEIVLSPNNKTVILRKKEQSNGM